MMSTTSRRPGWRGALVAIVVMLILAMRVHGQSVGSRFIASLRIARPQAVTAAAAAAPATRRQLLPAITGILTGSDSLALNEPPVLVPSADSASHLAGFHVRVPTSRTDLSRVTVLGAERSSVRVNRSQLQTLFAESGRGSTVPASADGAAVTLSHSRGIRAEYGHCPAPVDNSLQTQIQGPPPPSTSNGDCVIITETPVATISAPAALDTAAVMEIALELNGMSPDQTRDFRRMFDWPAALSLSLPRGIRSYQIIDVDGAKGMLMITTARREPPYALVWVRGGVVYTIAGYGSSADALPLAKSLS
jgi:hypothetical protein